MGVQCRETPCTSPGAGWRRPPAQAPRVPPQTRPWRQGSPAGPPELVEEGEGDRLAWRQARALVVPRGRLGHRHTGQVGLQEYGGHGRDFGT